MTMHKPAVEQDSQGEWVGVTFTERVVLPITGQVIINGLATGAPEPRVLIDGRIPVFARNVQVDADIERVIVTVEFYKMLPDADGNEPAYWQDHDPENF
jgi:hypothetical protein